MTLPYWQSKIWGLLQDPFNKSLYNGNLKSSNHFWQHLGLMKNWVEKNFNPEDSSNTVMQHIILAKSLVCASDRKAIASVTESINYNDNGLEISHLLSGEKYNFQLKQHQNLLNDSLKYLEEKEKEIFNEIPKDLIENETDLYKAKELFWWLWRCLPEVVCEQFDDDSLLLTPAENRLPDSSIWSHASLTSAMAGALTGHSLTTEQLEANWKEEELSHPYLVAFSFSPIQELIKASRKMRDYWAGSWILHYLSAKVCWKLALIYGADTLLYPSLFQQPLIDRWLLQKYPYFKKWMKKQPNSRQLLTAGFPNVIMLILPKEKVASAIETAKNELRQEWRNISQLVLDNLQNDRYWMRNLKPESNTWKGWLDSQWQTYYVGVPIGKEGVELTSSEIYQDNQFIEKPEEDKQWVKIQNKAYDLLDKQALFHNTELEFWQKATRESKEKSNRYRSNANVGSWWASIFDQTRLALSLVKNARNWEIPTAFGERSTVSGMGAVVHPIDRENNNDWLSEGQTKKYWRHHAGLFDGKEKLNATETVKRGLHKVLPSLLEITENELSPSYPDLTGGLAGYLKTGTKNEKQEKLDYFQSACKKIQKKVINDKGKIPDAFTQAWGIPWIDNHIDSKYREYHPRYLNAGWLVEELNLNEDIQEIKEEEVEQVNETNLYRNELQVNINQYYSHNNPTDWYVLSAGDGDGMSEWLKGKKLLSYQDYIASDLITKMENSSLRREFTEFIKLKKRMGPSTHSALSRALLDFSNQLVPYLTEERYAGRLIYGGGDDILAYSNLWEWDNWLWDVRQCFKGNDDPHDQFNSQGDYWYWKDADTIPEYISSRPLFTMGRNATISFGIIIAHHSVPMAIALENMWEAEEEAKEHYYMKDGQKKKKDAVQVRVIYGSGNILKASAKFETFKEWKQLLESNLDASIFELASNLWESHPAPTKDAIKDWVISFSKSRDIDEIQQNNIKTYLRNFLEKLWDTTLLKLINKKQKSIDQEIQNWLKLASFMIRKREIKIK